MHWAPSGQPELHVPVPALASVTVQKQSELLSSVVQVPHWVLWLHGSGLFEGVAAAMAGQAEATRMQEFEGQD